MAIDTIKSTAVLDGAIATADIADDAVTADKLANSINTSIAVGSTANTTANAALPKAGGTMTGDLIISDNVRVRLGSPTSTSYHSSHEVLQIGDGSALLGNDGSKGSQLITNAYTTAGSSLSGYKYIATDKASSYQQYDGAHNFRVAGSGSADAAITWTTAMTIANDGDVGINKTAPTAKLHIVGSNAAAVLKLSGGTTNGYYNFEVQNDAQNGYGVGFKHGGTLVGSIRTTGSATSYNTSSDYRLKENVTPMSGATAQTKLLKPCNFDWIAGGNVNGFLAHELAEVVPEAVSGTKDAMMDEEYEVTPATDTEAAVMGTRSVPDMQGIDQSKLVPLLVKTIQELEARITALEDA